MPEQLDIVAIVGSLRRASFTRRLVEAMMKLAPPSLKIDIVAIGDLPLYNQDADERPPEPWVAFRKRIERADAVLFATPEYNRSVPGVLKNAIDVASRPYGKSAWKGKPAAVISCSPGAIGAFGANHHLRQSLAYLDMPTMPQPEAYIGRVDKLLGDDGQIASDETREFLVAFLKAFESWVRQREQ